jgi:hypothetical protein
MKKIIIILVLLGLAAFGLKLFLEHKYESEIDEALTMMGASGMVKYDNVEVGVDSSITINGIRIQIPNFDDTIGVRSIKFNSSDSLFPFKGPKIFENGKYPEQFSVDVRGVDVDAALIEKANEEAYGEKCRSGFTVIRYTAAGLDRVNTDAFFEMDFRDPSSSGGSIRILDQLSSATVELEMDATMFAGVALGGDVPITKIELTTELDADLAEELIGYCAEEFKVTPEIFLNKVVGSPKFAQNTFGADLGPDMQKAMIEYMKGGKRFSFRARPTEKLGSYQYIANLRPDQILSRLNLSVSLDGLRVPTLIARETVEEKKARVEQAKGVDTEKNRQRKYVKVSKSSAGQYIGHRIQIYRRGDKKRIRGRMSGFSNKRVAIEVYRHGGEMTLNVPIGDVRTFEVLR